MRIKDIIEKLQQLKEKDYTVHLEINPEVSRCEGISGKGIETRKYIYTITLVGKETHIEYKNKGGIIEYVKEIK